MSDSVIISLIGLIISGVCWPVLKVLWGRIEQTKTEAMNAAAEAEKLAISALDKINQHRLHVAESYTSLKRFEGFETALFKKLDSIEDKLDGKVDK